MYVSSNLDTAETALGLSGSRFYKMIKIDVLAGFRSFVLVNLKNNLLKS